MSGRPQPSSSSTSERKRPRITSGSAAQQQASRLILPNDLLLKLKGRRVVVRLTTQRVEIEAVLAEVEVDSGNLSLIDAIVFQATSPQSSGVQEGEEAAADKAPSRELVEKANKLIVNGKYVSMVSVKPNEE